MRWECEPISHPWLAEMPTSIVQIYTPEGFVVAADGREYDITSGETLADNIRKIFPVSGKGRALLYSISGTNKLTSLGGVKDDLNLLCLLHDSVSKRSDSRCKSLWHYAEALIDAIDLPEHEVDDEPTVIYLDGYYDRRSKRGTIKLFHNGEKSPQISVDDPTQGKIEGCGSNVVLNALRDNLEITAKYRTPSWRLQRSEITLVTALDLARSYIGAQCDDEVRQLDPKWFKSIGGVGHLCVLRASGEFEWMFRNVQTGDWIACDPPTGPTVP